MRLLAVLCLVGAALATETNFLEFTKNFNKNYRSVEEYNKRRETFLRNYNDMLAHNQLYEEGKVTWWKKITEWSDLTPEEFAEHMNLGMPALDKDMMTNTIDEVMEGRIGAGNAPAGWSREESPPSRTRRAAGAVPPSPPSPPSRAACGSPPESWRTTCPSST